MIILFEQKIVKTKNKFLAANFPSRFINGVCNDFLNKENNDENVDFIIQSSFFDFEPLVMLIEIPYRDKNEVASKHFIKKFNEFTNDKYDIRLKWFPRKMKTLFKLKYPCIHPPSKIYKGICICGETYIGETIGKVETRWKEHNAPSDKSNLWKPINSHFYHSFAWSTICIA